MTRLNLLLTLRDGGVVTNENGFARETFALTQNVFVSEQRFMSKQRKGTVSFESIHDVLNNASEFEAVELTEEWKVAIASDVNVVKELLETGKMPTTDIMPEGYFDKLIEEEQAAVEVQDHDIAKN